MSAVEIVCLRADNRCLGSAVVLIGDEGTILSFNARAAGLIGADLKMRAGRLCASDRASDHLLQDLLRAALAVPLTHNLLLPPVVIERATGRPIIAQVLPPAGLRGPSGEPARSILLLLSLEMCPELPESRLMLLFKLTAAEARLAAKLAAGGTIEEAADALGISLGTVRNQLKAVFLKTGTGRQGALVALLWRVSNLAISRSLFTALLAWAGLSGQLTPF